MNVAHVATIAAYPIDQAKGGGFRGVLLVRETKERRASDRFETLEQARYWAQTEAYNTYSTQPGYSLASIRMRGEYRANVWVQA